MKLTDSSFKIFLDSMIKELCVPVSEFVCLSGILAVVAIGVALGVFLGGLLLLCAAKVIKK